MKPDPMPEPDGPEDERFVYVVTAAGVKALRESAAAFDSELERPVSNRAFAGLVLEPAVDDREPPDGDRQSEAAGAEPQLR